MNRHDPGFVVHEGATRYVRAARRLSELGLDWAISIDDSTDGSLIFRRGLSVLREHGHLLVAICLNNGYYKRARIRALIEVAATLSSRVTIFFTDGPAKHNYLALGRSPHKTEQQIRKQRNQLRNACDDAINCVKRRNVQFGYVDWNSVYERRDYAEAMEELTNLYATNLAFTHDIRSATEEVLSRSASLGDLDRMVDIGIHYTLEELAFLLIFGRMAAEPDRSAGEEFGYIYHMRWPILENLVNGHYDGRVRKHVGFILIDLHPSSASSSTS